ncbi:unnamed protein product [Ectocarpus sp. 12 AP-2014]
MLKLDLLMPLLLMAKSALFSASRMGLGLVGTATVCIIVQQICTSTPFSAWVNNILLLCLFEQIPLILRTTRSLFCAYTLFARFDSTGNGLCGPCAQTEESCAVAHASMLSLCTGLFVWNCV